VQLYLIRHTTPAVPPGVCYGQADVDVAATFFDEAARVRHKLADLAPAASYSSPLARAARLAESLGFGPPEHDPRLMELDFGDWELQSWESIPRAHLDAWGHAYTHVAPPGGETFNALHQRAVAFMQELIHRHRGQDVVVVTHAGVIRALLAEALNLPLVEGFRFHLDYGSVSQIRWTDSAPVVGYVNR
jgi:alpha-ribazole phosphatase